MKRYLLYCFLVLVILFAGCSGSTRTKEITETARIGGNESVTMGLGVKDHKIVIQKGLLGEGFVMMPTLIAITSPYTTTAVFASKLVYFEKISDRIYMMEDIKSQTVTDPYDPIKILAEFPIVQEDEGSVTFDFKTGFDNLIINAGDYDDNLYPDVAIPVAASFLEEFVAEEDLFSINHLAQVILDGKAVTVTFNYAFVPDREDGLGALLPDDRFGYFLTKPAFERSTGEPTRMVNRWDISKPITFYVSNNTPSEYVGAVKEGILAWNKAFGRDVMKAEMAPDDVISGDPRYNVVQWVGFDDAGFAYANWHAHPRTGEILNAYVILTSRFAVGGKMLAERLLKELENVSDATDADSNKMRVGLIGFKGNRRCDEDFENQYREFLKVAASGEITDDQVLKVSQMFVRSVVMHEVGHDLGLRHNFHGNLGSEIPLDEDIASLKEYISGDVTDGPMPSSSIMDYLDFQDKIRMHSPGVYDIKAIRWAYELGGDISNPPPYCTDGDRPYSPDCAWLDRGAEPILWRQYEIERYGNYLTRWLEDKLSGTENAEGEPNPRIVPFYLMGLSRYLNATQRVLSLESGTEKERRGTASEIIARYLTASDESYNSLSAIVEERILKSLKGSDSEDVQDYLLAIRYSYVSEVLSAVASLVNASASEPVEGGGCGDGGCSDDSPGGQSLYNDKGVVVPLANATASVAANHLSLLEPSEPAELRFKAAHVLASFEGEMAGSIKESAIERILQTVSNLEEELEETGDPKMKERIEQLISVEQSILDVLGYEPPHALKEGADKSE